MERCSDDEVAQWHVYESVRERCKLSWPEFKRDSTDFRIIPVKIGERIVGGVMVRGNELHIGCTERPRGASFRKYLDILQDVVSEFGCAVTVLSPDCKATAQVKRLGFVQVGEYEGWAIMKCERVAPEFSHA